MKRHLVAAVAALLMGVAFLFPAAAQAKNSKVDVCHNEGNGSYGLINISEKAVAKHIANHRDGLPGGALPDEPGSVFGDDCVPELVGPALGCYDNDGSVGDFIDLEYVGPINVVDNVVLWNSIDGTCGGAFPSLSWAVVIADDLGVASGKCIVVLGPGGIVVFDDSLYNLGWTGFQPDAYLCRDA